MATVAEATNGYSGADLASLCNKATLLAIRDYLENRKGNAKGYKGFTISKKNMLDARKIIEQQRTPGV